jgi:general secretion pathway protein D
MKSLPVSLPDVTSGSLFVCAVPQIWRRPARTLLMALVLMLAGCAGQQAYKEANSLLSAGKVEEGLSKLEEAVRLEPGNAGYRITLANRRASAINSAVQSADNARREGRLNDAELAYRQVQSLDSGNVMARQGLEALQRDIPLRRMVTEAEALLKKGGVADVRAATQKIRQVLAEAPAYKPAQGLVAQMDEMRRKEKRNDQYLASAFRQPISLEFRDAPLKAVLEVMAKTAGVNFFYDKDIRPDMRATIFARKTTVEDALRLILATNQLEQKVLNDNSILIYPSTPQKIKDYQTLSVRSFYLTNADVKAVASTIKTIVKTKDLVVDDRLGIIIMRDTPQAIRMAERIVALQDLSDPEVMLEVEILEVKRSRMLELGIQWPNQLKLSPLQIGGAPVTLRDLTRINNTTTQAQLSPLTVNANKEDGDVNVLANPRIRVRNKERAKIQIGDRLPIITTTSTSTGFVSESVNYLDVGLKLEVEPNIYLDDEVAIRVNLEVSTLGPQITSKSGTTAYQIGTRGANTTLRLKDGETQILAGLIQDSDRSSAGKIPFLGDLPLIGRLFGSQKDNNERNEILLSITPRILRSIQRPDMLSAEFDSGTESNIGGDALLLSDEASPATKGAASVAKVAAPVDVSFSSVISPALTPASRDAAKSEVDFSWKYPATVKVGEQFTAVLQLNSGQELRDISARVAYDPKVLRVVSVHEGEFFKQDHAHTNFSQRVNPVQGRIFLSVERTDEAGDKGLAHGAGDFVIVTLQALKAAVSSKVTLVAATSEPEPPTPITIPLEFAVKVTP